MIRRLISTLALVIICATAMPAAALAAYNPFSNLDCGSAANSAVCNDKNNPRAISGPQGIILTATNIIALIAGIAAVIIIIVAAIQFVTSGGDANAVSGARNTIIGALIGLIVIVLAKVVITFVVNRI